jgi:hypothetical protein
MRRRAARASWRVKMAWFTRFTRFGDAHFVFGQELGNTCGPSSALMCYTKLMKLAPGAAFYGNTNQMEAWYAEWYGKPYDGNKEGTWPEGLVYALNKAKCGTWTFDTYSPNDTAQAIDWFVGRTSGWGATVKVKPIIVGVNWDGSKASHWVCVDTVREWAGQLYATVCDPWDADVHVQKMKIGTQFVYEAKEELHIDFGGTHYSYNQPSTGRVRTWPIIHLTS